MVSRTKPFQADLTGYRFGRLVVRSLVSGRGKITYWKCSCDCGGEKVVYRKNLLNGNVKSCGCLISDRKFGSYGEIRYRYWNMVVARMGNYSGIPITIQEAWSLFLAQNRRCALSGIELTFAGGKYCTRVQTASLDRIDSSKGYLVGNVQWVHKDLNSMKRNYPDAVFIDWCIKVASWQRM